MKRHLHVLHALADALLLHRTLDTVAIDEVIMIAVANKALADEAERRRQWAQRIENAARFEQYRE